MTVDSLLNKVELVLDFGIKSDVTDFIYGSWSHAEQGHTWALAPSCGLSLPINQTASRKCVLIDFMPATAPPNMSERRVIISCRDVVIFDARIEERSIISLLINCSPESAFIDLKFFFDEYKGTIPNETRPLAFAFRKVTVIAVPFIAEVKARHFSSAVQLELSNHSPNIQRLIEQQSGMALGSFVRLFESLGHSCDFGLFQRQLLSEPLGLLRFAGLSTPDLVEGIINKFDGLAAPQTLEANSNPDWGGEYMVFDKVYGLCSHTFLNQSQASPEQVVARERFRLQFLKGLFLETLALGDKVYVLRRPKQTMQTEAEAVLAALRLHSDCKLLWAVQEQGGDPGSVDFVAPNLLRGHLDVTSSRGSASIDAWLCVCWNAYLHFKEGIRRET